MSAVTDLQKSEEIIVVANRPPQTKFISKEIKKTVQPIIDTDILITSADWFNLHSTIIEIVDDFHRSYPLQRGVPREELKSRLIAARKLSAESFDIFLRKTLETGELAELGPIIFRPSHEIVFSDEQQRNIDDLLIRFHKNPYSPPSVKECQTHLGDDVFRALIDLGQFIVVSNDVVFLKEDFDRMVQELIKLFAKTDKLTAAEVRDHFRTSRKYALAFLEYLDSIEITIREGDIRRLR
jgi:selenocysteine-specific elongation factor